MLAYGDHPDDSLTPVIDVHEVYARWRRNIEQIFDRWAEMPEPDAFDAKIDQLRPSPPAGGRWHRGRRRGRRGRGDRRQPRPAHLRRRTSVTEVGDCEGEAFEALYDGYLAGSLPS